ncbi:MAG: hypothetical protein GWP61_27885 [Chloroflexi bacterium]|nr:hypothetical protein [Chloroflexota bacterium]
MGDLNIDDGEVSKQIVTIRSGGNYNAVELPSDETSITISGLGSAGVWANDVLDANISGGGSVNYNGRPR